MAPPGLAAYAARTEAKSAAYSYEQRTHPQLLAAEVEQFMLQPAAWSYFEACPPSYRRPVPHRIANARAETRTRRLAELIDACAR